MNLLLINCPVSLSKPYEDNEPLGILYIASVLLAEGHRVAVRDYGVETYDKPELTDLICAQSYDGILFSCRTASYVSCRQLVRDCLSSSFRGFFVLGGQHPSALPEQTLKEIEADPLFLVRGEGEATVTELIRALEASRSYDDFKDIDGLSFKIDGRVCHTKERKLISNIDTLPFPARHLINMELYAMKIGGLPAFNVITSRGCPYNCIYCQKNIFKNRIRQRSPENIAEEIVGLVRSCGRNAFYFVDDLFTYDIERIEKLFDILTKQNIRIRWRCLSRADKVNTDILNKIKSWGCEKIVFGFESGDPFTLKKVNKGIDTKTIRKAAFLTGKAGIRFKANFMTGFPWDNYRSVFRTFHFAATLPVNDEYKIFSVTPFPGTKIWNMYIKEGLVDESNVKWEEFLVTDYAIRNKNIHSYFSKHLPIIFYLYVFYVRLGLSLIRKENLRIFISYFGKINLKHLVRISFRPDYSVGKSVQGELVDYKYKRYPGLIKLLIKGMTFFESNYVERKTELAAALFEKYPLEAEQLIHDILKYTPDDFQSHFELAKQYHEKHQMEKGLHHIKKCLECGGDSIESAVLYGVLSSGNLSNDKWLSRYSRKGEFLKRFADKLFDGNNYEKALDVYEQVWATGYVGDSGCIFMRLAFIHMFNKNYEKAFEYYLKAFELKNEIDIQNALVDSFSRLCDEKPDIARESAVSIANDKRSRLRVTGTLLIFLVDLKADSGKCSVESIETIKGPDPFLITSILYRIASDLKNHGDLKKSQTIFRFIIKSDQHFVLKDTYKGGACYHVGEMLFHDRSFSEALPYFKQCLLWIPDHKKADSYLKRCIESA